MAKQKKNSRKAQIEKIALATASLSLLSVLIDLIIKIIELLSK